MSSGGLSFFGFSGGAVIWSGWSFGEAAVAGVDEEPHVGVGVEEVVDAFGAYGGLVVLAAGSDGSGPERPAVGVGGDGGFDGVLLLLAGHERSPSGSVGLGPADLDLGAVEAQGDAFGGGVGDDVGEGVQALSGGGGEASVGQ
jgi:hypothetical protein